MTAAFEPTPQHDPALVPAVSANVVAAKAAVAPRLLPPIMIGVGLIVTIGWMATLLWLFSRLILAFM